MNDFTQKPETIRSFKRPKPSFGRGFGVAIQISLERLEEDLLKLDRSKWNTNDLKRAFADALTTFALQPNMGVARDNRWSSIAKCFLDKAENAHSDVVPLRFDKQKFIEGKVNQGYATIVSAALDLDATAPLAVKLKEIEDYIVQRQKTRSGIAGDN